MELKIYITYAKILFCSPILNCETAHFLKESIKSNLLVHS